MHIRHLAFAALSALMLVGCTAPAPSSGAPKAPAAEHTAEQAASRPTAPAPIATPAAPGQSGKAPGAMEGKPTLDAANPSRSCRTDSDCTVKDVGNCCGAYPMCVGKNAKTDPAAVRAQCAKDGMASICGFQEVSGCQCVKGQCENLGSGAAVM